MLAQVQHVPWSSILCSRSPSKHLQFSFLSESQEVVRLLSSLRRLGLHFSELTDWRELPRYKTMSVFIVGFWGTEGGIHGLCVLGKCSTLRHTPGVTSYS